MLKTAFFWNERCFWHGGGHYASIAPVGGMVQPLAAGGSPENPETKRRLKSLLDVSGLAKELEMLDAETASYEDLNRIHPASYLEEFKGMSDANGGELGLRTPFLKGGYEISALSAGLVKAALLDVLDGKYKNAYALSRPPGHHCLPDYPNGFCLLANIPIAIEAAIAAKKVQRVAVVDWDVHHGNGTEAIYLERDDVLTISLHQENNYPPDSGAIETIGEGDGRGHNMNIPLPPGAGHDAYIYAFDTLVLPALENFKPDVIVVACGFDASLIDPLSRMLASSYTFREMTIKIMQAADDLCDGKLVMAHEGGYSEVHVPFCGHAVLETMSGSKICLDDPIEPRAKYSQPNARFSGYYRDLIDEYLEHFKSVNTIS
ncbi:MAG: class II histone deacetylase [Rhizobiaceae bacterium]|nr:class II histone deacetylase [Rhizobiaceae bacterium]